MRGGAPRRAGLVLALALGGCGVLPRQPVPTALEGEWAAQRDRFTRSAKAYDRLDDQVFVTATYQAPSVRQARAERLAEWKAMTAEERERLLASERAEGEQAEEFLLAFYTNDRAANDLASTQSVWRLALAVEAGELLPVRRPEIVRADATVTGLYPYVGQFDIVYRVRFPRWKGERPLHEIPFTLVVAGALAKVELRFNQPAEGGARPPPGDVR
ncbi:MAG TPA: hypothetical protein VFR85_10225 [Anaeromyxobacteraceae bacterium]|nr:hypothetical protein [Anaeromyxobacteraceae bacterium]